MVSSSFIFKFTAQPLLFTPHIISTVPLPLTSLKIYYLQLAQVKTYGISLIYRRKAKKEQGAEVLETLSKYIP